MRQTIYWYLYRYKDGVDLQRESHLLMDTEGSYIFNCGSPDCYVPTEEEVAAKTPNG